MDATYKNIRTIKHYRNIPCPALKSWLNGRYDSTCEMLWHKSLKLDAIICINLRDTSVDFLFFVESLLFTLFTKDFAVDI